MTRENCATWRISRESGTIAPVILTSSDRFAATSSIKEEEGV
tara:strand:- start:895 stop:1020 length:126 start_codon:yes stop_codon:yes gene_type:complete